MDFVILFNDTIITKESPKKHLKHFYIHNLS